MTAIARRYAKALFEATPTCDRDTVVAELATIQGVLADPEVGAAILSPDLPEAARRAACEKLVEGAHATLRNLVQVFLHRRRESVLFDIEPEFRALLLASRGELEGVVETAKPMDAQLLESLEQTATKLTGKQVALRVEEHPDLIGGVRMRVGNTLFDSSVATAIDELERQLRAVPIG